MIRAALVALVLAALPAAAQETGPAAEARRAAEGLREAIAALDTAEGARDRVAALTTTIGAYEAGLGTLREALRAARLRETELTLRFETGRARLSRLLGVLAQLRPDAGPELLLHPGGPLGTARSGMVLTEITPALRAEVEDLRAELAELAELRALQEGAAALLAEGLERAQSARTTLSQAISNRTDLPRRLTDDPAALAALAAAADTLDALAAGLVPDEAAPPGFAAARGRLPLPALGRAIRGAGETDASGVTRPGIALATRAQALVTAPWPATVRFRGPLLDYGNVMVLDPGEGYLLILGGLGTVWAETGEVVAAGAPLGLMGGPPPGPGDFLAASPDGGAVRETETLYIELRQGTRPEDPAPWFAALRG
jgi:septal ring factor EnvC (AmiA/AmiB activator)